MANAPTSVTKGAALTISMRWADRLIGLVSVIILARLLAPEDFGIIVMASLVIGLVDALLDLGVHIPLIQNRSATQSHYDTAWTLRLLQATLAAGLVWLAAPWAAGFFNEPQVTLVIQVLAISFLLSGLENIGVVNFQKEMRFGKEFQFLFAKRMAGFIATISLALLLQSFWALVAGTLVARLVGLALSYAMHPMRPRASLARFGEIFGVSQWVLARNVGVYLDQSLHLMLVGRRDTTGVTGGYSMANEVSSMPTTELLAPINRVLFPAFVQVKHDLSELKRLFLLAQGVQALIVIPAGVGLALVAEGAVMLLLGEQWGFIVPFVEIIALVTVVTALMSSGVFVCITLGRVALMAFYAWFQVALFALLATVVFTQADAEQIAAIRLLTALLSVGVFAWILTRTLEGLAVLDIIKAVYRPILAALMMSVCVLGLGGLLSGPDWWLLVCRVAIGVLSYIFAVALLWWVSGGPPGAERYVLDKLCPLVKPILRRVSRIGRHTY
ncbi:lipopolysaccharide biosynthesis protein [Ectothiorhodospira variabilis]|uniref:lipopolysaccharide biosynthesis protein n=1 Tax=Ectothiorhodospira variabilis TaxID=505694 RepID=UPI001EFBDEA6|nr:lipopolysaccharide biosynthesis protein [Ectothiorhodospira variabilis]MCG5497545.1 lipopolysaccharide biosynthesis protein [Ectothiorhodospira variabilis]